MALIYGKTAKETFAVTLIFCVDFGLVVLLVVILTSIYPEESVSYQPGA